MLVSRSIWTYIVPDDEPHEEDSESKSGHGEGEYGKS